jgi:single-stranded-DNA-specific exonuclease
MAGRCNIGLAALADVAGLKEPAGIYHLGFVLGPRINAGGRVGAADLGVRLLTCADAGEAAVLARRLDELNAERRAIEQGVLDQAVAQVDSDSAVAGAVIVAAGADWHPGVIGIVAGRLKERYNRPACVVALEQGTGRGSGRSVPGFDLGSAVVAARQAGLLLNGGGHAMAAGFTVAVERLPDLCRFLGERFAGQACADPVPVMAIDGALTPAGVTPELAALIERVGPFGSGNPEPRFALPGARVVRAEVVGDAHVRAVLAGADESRLKAIAFRSLDTDVGQALLRGGVALHLAGTLRSDNWQGRAGVQFLIEDAAPAVSREL